MSLIERDVVFQGKDENGNPTMDFPITRLSNVEDGADIKENLGAGDYIPVMDGSDNGQMKKVPYSALENKLMKPQILVKTEDGATVSVSNGTVTYTKTGGDLLPFNLDGFGTWTAVASKGGSVGTTVSVNVDAVKIYAVTASTYKVYGAEWDGSSTVSWTRTDAAAGFTDPVPYVSGATEYGSPFDNIQPWAGMVKTERHGGTMVAIPKFYYKLTQNGPGMKIQISIGHHDGFQVSPAHMDRGDGKGERDVVYVARYHCAASDYKSKTGETPKADITRSKARADIHAIGENIWQSDFATRFTIWLLYLVEFANWNSQNTIGCGCSPEGSVVAMGYTDTMPYHTGTDWASREEYGGTQYRNIEGLWDNVRDWCDGCYNNENGFNIVLNPADFSDTENGVTVGTTLLSGVPSEFTVSDAAGFAMFYGSNRGGSTETYSCDGWYFAASDPCVCVGGHYYQNASFGLFYVYHCSVDYSYSSIGCRLLELP